MVRLWTRRRPPEWKWPRSLRGRRTPRGQAEDDPEIYIREGIAPHFIVHFVLISRAGQAATVIMRSGQFYCISIALCLQSLQLLHLDTKALINIFWIFSCQWNSITVRWRVVVVAKLNIVACPAQLISLIQFVLCVKIIQIFGISGPVGSNGPSRADPVAM